MKNIMPTMDVINFAEDTLSMPLIASRRCTASSPALPTLNSAAERPTNVNNKPRISNTPAHVDAHFS